jgi:trimeric autotransporter adhesin
MRVSLPWTVAEPVGNIITEIVGSIPPEFNDLNNIDSLRFEAALPLTLLSFNGKVQQGLGWLQWQTTDEVNVSHFEIERSTNGVSFDVVGRSVANNRLGRQQYQFTDSGFALLPEGPVFYRLRMVDKDGSYRYSPVVKLHHEAPQMVVKAYPNPVKHNLLVELQSVRGGRYQLRLLDLNGRTILLQQHQVQHGRQTITVSMQQLPAGMYLLLIQDGDGVMREVKVMKE